MESNEYIKILSNFITKEIPKEEIIFLKEPFEKVETEHRLTG